ncbi:hypothetical protein TVAG_553940 [Trichomonas vaginalis G3]|uniref:Uncharacterized protein n=1 Tax=Trichomonas vaginalis (strain ATCC PRA-98 / G3) TaxID=412133 RepID=A2G9F3_TRIV3|nr:hypothetical protein TVAGG3_0419110 [Trichomonas vaginalis G3]EAX86218.1 hypothetical protein TVAG_553940 [Trichomonas vaginalis G3]KAI5535913.1 hypothetical protein TVAGG3_0419110 [Trichomonas vaginalis G3]|eukprot:XP_001299148.1 hypothetical protein [Trichomonas vaginalis G3]
MKKNLVQGIIMAGALIVVAIVFAFMFCLYIDTFENNTDKPKNSDTGANAIETEMTGQQEYEINDLLK